MTLSKKDLLALGAFAAPPNSDREKLQYVLFRRARDREDEDVWIAEALDGFACLQVTLGPGPESSPFTIPAEALRSLARDMRARDLFNPFPDEGAGTVRLTIKGREISIPVTRDPDFPDTDVLFRDCAGHGNPDGVTFTDVLLSAELLSRLRFLTRALDLKPAAKDGVRFSFRPVDEDELEKPREKRFVSPVVFEVGDRFRGLIMGMRP